MELPSHSNQDQACAKKETTITRADLPLSCPLPGERVWDAHPRVYLALDDAGSALCPYCGRQYHLSE